MKRSGSDKCTGRTNGWMAVSVKTSNKQNNAKDDRYFCHAGIIVHRHPSNYSFINKEAKCDVFTSFR